MRSPPNLLAQGLRFAGVGVVGLAVDVVVLYLIMALGLGWAPARLLSFLAAVWVTWQLNRRYTFTSADASVSTLWRYLLAMSGGGLLNYAVYSASMLFLPAWWPLPGTLLPLFAVAAGSLAGTTANFLGAKFLVFSR